MLRFLMLFFTASLTFCIYGTANGITQNPPLDWVSHFDAMLPGLIGAIKMVGWTIGSLLSLIGLLVGFIGRAYLGRQEKRHSDQIRHNVYVNDKLDTIHDVMLSCDGCRDSAIKYGRRKEDNPKES